MKPKILRYLIISLIISLALSFCRSSWQDENKKNKFLISLVLSSLENYHFEPKDINDDFAEKVFETYILQLDYNKRLLLQSDVDKLEKIKYQIDDEIKAGNSNFFELSYSMAEKRLKNVEDYFTEILEKPFDFNKKEKFETDPEERNYASDDKSLKEVWRKMLKNQVLRKVHFYLKKQEKDKEESDTVKIESFSFLEEKSRKKVLKTYKDWFKRMNQLEKKDRFNLYLNCITNVFDPHTNYYPPREKENFDISMSGQLEGIGATLQSSDGYIKIVRIITGSPSWKQGELKTGDLITKVAQADGEPVDVIDMRLDDAVQLIRGKKGTEVRLTVKKKDGSYKVIPIIRDVVVIETTYAKSSLIEDKDKKYKIAYIDLPIFYVDFKNSGGRRCSDDIEKELKKINDENVDALILDLRNNTGGSLNDVVKIGGFFIKDGPIVQVKTSNEKVNVLKDNDPRVQFDKPVVVLVNSISASASEILAAALQDYKRAIIIGSKSTFGKGTVQRFVNFDDILPPIYDYMKPAGSIKLTTQKFYRIDGHSTQLKGVTPDIILPDNYSFFEFGEKEQDFAVKWDEILSANYVVCTDYLKNIKRIKKNSKKRSEKNKDFSLIYESAKFLKKRSEDTKISLNYEKYKKNEKKIEKVSEKYKDLFTKKTDLKFSNLKIDMTEIEKDTTILKSRKEWLDALSKDIYVKESFSVLKELINK